MSGNEGKSVHEVSGAMTLRKVLAFPESAELAVHLEEMDAELKAVE